LREKLCKITFAIIFLALSGCDDEMHLKAKLTTNDVGVAVEIVKAKAFKENGKDKSLVYGTLAFEDLKQLAAQVNLTCIAISIGEVSSENVYVDSVAYILPDRYKIDRDRSKVSVYWKMNNQFSAESAGKELKVFIREGCDLLLKQQSINEVTH
jgi:hypothetical protein